MKITKSRLQKLLNSKTIQTRKKCNKKMQKMEHTSTFRNRKQFNLKNYSLKNWGNHPSRGGTYVFLNKGSISLASPITSGFTVKE